VGGGAGSGASGDDNSGPGGGLTPGLRARAKTKGRPRSRTGLKRSRGTARVERARGERASNAKRARPPVAEFQ